MERAPRAQIENRLMSPSGPSHATSITPATLVHTTPPCMDRQLRRSKRYREHLTYQSPQSERHLANRLMSFEHQSQCKYIIPATGTHMTRSCTDPVALIIQRYQKCVVPTHFHDPSKIWTIRRCHALAKPNLHL